MPSVIETPIESLPHVDEHAIEFRGTERGAWDALLETLPRGAGSGLTRRGAAVLGAEHATATGEFGRIGSTIPGFVVARAVPPAVLALLGQHRFSRYALIFRIEKTDAGVRVRAETRAEFPGAKGHAYRALVIGSRGHVVAVRRMLGRIRQHAERR